MKYITVKYNANGHIAEVTNNSMFFEQENEALCINAYLSTDKKIRAYIKSANNNSTVTDEISLIEETYCLVVEGEYMAKGTLYVGFEVYDDNGYVERYEPLKVCIDSFVSLDKSKNDNVYVVTVNVGEVQTLHAGAEATVKNAGNKKDVILNFGIPRGEQGLKGDKGDKGETGPQGEKGDKGEPFRYEDFTAEQLNALTGPQGKTGPQGEKGDKGDPFVYEDFTSEQLETLRGPQGEAGPQGEQGIQGIQGIPGEKGDKGDKGETGSQGEKGDPFVYEDFTSEQLETLRGPQGEAGPQGETGPQGEKGDTGKIGPQGEPGYTPVKGVDYFTEEDIDNELSEISQKPVQNKVVTESIKNLETQLGGIVFTVKEDGILNIIFKEE